MFAALWINRNSAKVSAVHHDTHLQVVLGTFLVNPQTFRKTFTARFNVSEANDQISDNNSPYYACGFRLLSENLVNSVTQTLPFSLLAWAHSFSIWLHRVCITRYRMRHGTKSTRTHTPDTECCRENVRNYSDHKIKGTATKLFFFYLTLWVRSFYDTNVTHACYLSDIFNLGPKWPHIQCVRRSQSIFNRNRLLKRLF